MLTLEGPLKGIRILDLTRLLPGPLATQYLADLGADVIKIEDVDFPDYIRFFPPQIGGQSIHYLAINRSKSSLSIKLGSEEGLAIFYKLIESADIVIESFRPGRMEKMQLGYEQAKKINPAIIYVSVTGYGQSGPLAAKAGHDLNYIGYSGVLALGGKDGKVVMPGVQIADIMGGSANTIIACLTAIIARQNSGKGQKVDVSMTDGAMQMALLPLIEYLNVGEKYSAGKYMLSGGLANYYVYECKDGKFMALGALEPKFWVGFCKMIDEPKWMNEALPIPDKVAALKEKLQTLFKTKTRQEWEELAENHDVCLTPVLEMDEIENHPNTVARKLIKTHKHPKYGSIKSVAMPLQFSESKLHDGWAPPLLGEHSKAILENLNYTESQIVDWIKQGIVKVSS